MLATVIGLTRVANAHQLDEYLQATRIAIEPGRITVEMSLTPGAAVAKQIFSSLDADGNDSLSPFETAAYGRSVLRDLVLESDGRSYPLTLMRAESPSWPEMRRGVGTIRLQAEANVAIGRGRHRLRFVNNHRSDISVYLVNALRPSAAIAIHAQRRDVQQHGIELELDRSPAYLAALWIVVPLAGLCALIMMRGHDFAAHRGAG